MEPVCQLIDIEKRYATKTILDHFNLTVSRGEMVAITGRSGSGKTTVLNILGLLEKPDSGEVKLFGKSSAGIRLHQASLLRRERISYLFQNFALIDEETVDYNLEISLVYSHKPKKEKQILKQKVLERLGLDIPLHQRIYALSGGEQQRVALARILLKPSELILADEPTGSLDDANRNAILDMLRNLNQAGKTIVIVTHDPYVAEACDRTERLTFK